MPITIGTPIAYSNKYANLNIIRTNTIRITMIISNICASDNLRIGNRIAHTLKRTNMRQ
jgi:transposase-like protein